MTESSPERLSVDQVQATFDASPFLRFLQLRAVVLDHDAGTLTVTMPMRPELERRLGTAQFGTITQQAGFMRLTQLMLRVKW